jgi:hypothetical protein
MQTDNQVTVQGKKQIQRSTAYPSTNLEEAIQNSEKIKKALSTSPFNRENGAKALGYSGVSGASSAKIAALVHFGLVDRVGDVYRLSQLSDRILIPRSEDDKQNAIQEALKNPKLYRDLIDKFKDQSLPTLLSNILIHDHKINESVSKQVSRDFISSLEYAGLLVNGVVTDSEGVNPPDANNQLPSLKISPEDSNIKPSFINTETYSIPLPSGIVVNFPSDQILKVSMGDFAAPLRSLEEIANGTSTFQNSNEKTGHSNEE